MPRVNLPAQGGSSTAYSPMCGSVGVNALRGPAVLQSALAVTPRVALAQADIVSGSFIGSGAAFGGSRLAVANNVVSWSTFASGFTLGWWMKPLAAANNTATIFDCYLHDPVAGTARQLVRIKRTGTTNNIEMMYQSGGAAAANGRTDSTPWVAGSWAHYAVTFSSSKTMVFYKNGVAIQFDVITDAGGSTPSNVTSHTFNTPIPAAARNCAFLFGGSLTAANDDFGGEAFNIGYWNTALGAAEIPVLAATSKLDLALNSGAYVSSGSLQFNPRFASRDASASYVVLPTVGLDAYRVELGATVP